MSTTLIVEHREHVTTRSFEDVLSAFNSATGSVEEGFSNIAKDIKTVEDFQSTFESREGTSGFMRFQVLNHGYWLTQFYNQPTKAVMVVLGNPLIAITMLKHDVGAGLNVPVRLYIFEGSDGQTRVTYDVPSSLMGNLSEAARAAATKLDEKLTALVVDITGVEAA